MNRNPDSGPSAPEHRTRGLLAGLVVSALAVAMTACAPAPSSTGDTPQHSSSGPSRTSPVPAAPSGTASATSSVSPSARASSSSTGASSSPSATPTAPAKNGDCLAAAKSLDLDHQVALLYMGAITTTSDSQAAGQLAAQKTGSVILMANPGSADATRQLTAALRRTDPQVMVAVDQEGGEVQRLSGPGFDQIPEATAQATQSVDALTADWATWGGQLTGAGVDYNLAPVADLVPAANVSANEPIGKLGRGYGATKDQVVANTSAVIDGLHRAEVADATKHFPGLGNVTVNTDFGVAHDTVTTVDSDEVQTFAALTGRTDSMMISSVVYDRIDPDHPAMFSPEIVQNLLRGKLGFSKVIISDDLGAAAALSSYPVASRGTLFLRAGGDIALNVDPSTVPQMIADTVQAAHNDSAFAADLPNKAARVLTMEQSLGMTSCKA
ncbi:glycoside hydrolase family 3 N-terminal domain-containing protein [Propionibacterium sp.]|uniref:glycoside hydrolase family 3 N-terminal domain-containing protein n=1 Tax=Propionibacterium sp. TaxID=1977903 RepID=UPI0039E8F6F1